MPDPTTVASFSQINTLFRSFLFLLNQIVYNRFVIFIKTTIIILIK